MLQRLILTLILGGLIGCTGTADRGAPDASAPEPGDGAVALGSDASAASPSKADVGADADEDAGSEAAPKEGWFACGSTLCEAAHSYCSIWQGDANDSFYTCLPLPDACDDHPSCECLDPPTTCSCSADAVSGGLTVAQGLGFYDCAIPPRGTIRCGETFCERASEFCWTPGSDALAAECRPLPENCRQDHAGCDCMELPQGCRCYAQPFRDGPGFDISPAYGSKACADPVIQ